MEGRQFEGIFIGLGPAVAEEKMIVRIAADGTQFFGQRVLQTILHGIGVKAQPGNLLRDGLHIMRVTVADADDGVSAVKVQIFLPGGIPQPGAAATDRLYIPPFIYIE